MAAAATKISAVYKGNKDREMVKELKAARESASAEAGKPDAPDENAAWSKIFQAKFFWLCLVYLFVYIYFHLDSIKKNFMIKINLILNKRTLNSYFNNYITFTNS